MNLDDSRMVKREMEEVGRQAQRMMHPLEMVGVLSRCIHVSDLISNVGRCHMRCL
jgi:hypothetical protein